MQREARRDRLEAFLIATARERALAFTRGLWDRFPIIMQQLPPRDEFPHGVG